MHDLAQRHVGARRRPCQRHADQYAHDARCRAQAASVLTSGAIVLRPGKRAHEMLEAESLREAERAEHQPQQRIADEEQQQADRHARAPDPAAEPRGSGVAASGRRAARRLCGALHAIPCRRYCGPQLPHSPPKMLGHPVEIFVSRSVRIRLESRMSSFSLRQRRAALGRRDVGAARILAALDEDLLPRRAHPPFVEQQRRRSAAASP